MKKGYYLSTCNTCQRILKELGDLLDGFDLKEIKSDPLTLEEVDEMKQLSGTYESIFSRRSMQYRARNLGEKELTEEDYRQLIAEEYTFLKRPVFILNDQIFVGNTKGVVQDLRKALTESK